MIDRVDENKTAKLRSNHENQNLNVKVCKLPRILWINVELFSHSKLHIF